MKADYDSHEDVLYITIENEPVEADDAHDTNGIIVRTYKGKVVGFTFIDATTFFGLSKTQLKLIASPVSH